MGFGQGVSGLNAAASNLDVIGNNIANANTVGFKQSTAQFADVYAGSKIGLGTRVNAVVQSFTNGNISTSGRNLDVAISNGKGFFRLTNTDGQVFYSRNGQLNRLDDGRLVNATGLQVPGYPAGSSAGGVAPQPLVISNAQMPPKATTNIDAQFQLDSRSAAPTSTFTSNATTKPDSTMFSYSTAMTVYDSLGNKQQLTAYFGKSVVPGPPVAQAPANAFGGNDWSMNVTDSAGNVLQTVTLSFDSSGKLAAPLAGAMPSVTLPAANGAQAMTTQVNLTGTTQFGADNDPKSVVQNGYTSGALVGYSVQEDGTITGSYSNEQSMSLGQIAMASFGNVEGLKPEGDNVWSATGSSGQELLGTAGGAMGTLKSNAVEESNVDLSGQLVNLIVAQRNYQANAQTIKAQDTVMQTLVNL